MTAAMPWLDGVRVELARHRAHAILLHGPGGSGEFALALEAARTWLCEDVAAASGPALRACGRCAACRLGAARTHPDLMVRVPGTMRALLAAAPDDGGGDGPADAGDDGAEPAAGEGGGKARAKPSREILVAEVRAAIDWSRQTPARGRGKVLVIYPAEAMNAVAANALLKTLEEPPGRLRLLLVTGDPAALLPTIRSRCQAVRVPLAPPADAVAWLAERGLAQPEVLLAAAGGRIEDALALAADGLDAAAWLRLPAAVRAGDASALAGVPVPRVLGALLALCHDLMAVAAGAPGRHYPADALPAGAALPRLAAWGQSLRRTAKHADHPWNAALLIEALVSEGASCWPRSGARPAARPAGLATLDRA